MVTSTHYFNPHQQDPSLTRSGINLAELHTGGKYELSTTRAKNYYESKTQTIKQKSFQLALFIRTRKNSYIVG